MLYQQSIIDTVNEIFASLKSNDYKAFKKLCDTLDDIEENVISDHEDDDHNAELDWMHNYLFYKESRLVDLVYDAENLKRNRFVRYLMNTRLADLMKEPYECSDCKKTHVINHLSDKYSHECKPVN